MGKRWSDGYSADVEIYLMIDGRRYDVAQVSGKSLFLRDHHQILPGTNAELVMRIDDHKQSEKVVLQAGTKSDELAVNYV